MSPLSLRRHRAERLLREEFDALRGRVLASVRGKLRASGVTLDHDDLEACYAAAWQGLYAVVLDGQEIANPTGWLVLVTFRRAIEEHRARARAHCGAEVDAAPALAYERDLADELDDRRRLRQLFEGLRGRLEGREREAATLCYLQGLSRSEAAARMGVSETRMRKLMEGRAPGRPGVAAKVGALVGTIRDGDWCEEQGSLMRALAFGILEPTGERYRLALAHSSQCPACRAYVVSLRGLAVVLPPVFLPSGVCAVTLAWVGEGIHGVSAAGVASARDGARAAGGTACNGARASVHAGRVGGSLSASGAAGAGATAGGGWLIGAGPLSAKLAVGCLFALGVGVSCVALEADHHARMRRTRHLASRSLSRTSVGSPTESALYSAVGDVSSADAATADRASPAVQALTPAMRAGREFGPEQTLVQASSGASTSSATGTATAAQTASSRSTQLAYRRDAHVAPAISDAIAGQSAGEHASAASGVERSSVPPARVDSLAAEREFSPG
jgi:DNA-directed RNA polymerase specialized sigma24 family protein